MYQVPSMCKAFGPCASKLVAVGCCLKDRNAGPVNLN